MVVEVDFLIFILGKGILFSEVVEEGSVGKCKVVLLVERNCTFFPTDPIRGPRQFFNHEQGMEEDVEVVMFVLAKIRQAL